MLLSAGKGLLSPPGWARSRQPAGVPHCPGLPGPAALRLLPGSLPSGLGNAALRLASPSFSCGSEQRVNRWSAPLCSCSSGTAHWGDMLICGEADGVCKLLKNEKGGF